MTLPPFPRLNKFFILDSIDRAGDNITLSIVYFPSIYQLIQKYWVFAVLIKVVSKNIILGAVQTPAIELSVQM